MTYMFDREEFTRRIQKSKTNENLPGASWKASTQRALRFVHFKLCWQLRRRRIVFTLSGNVLYQANSVINGKTSCWRVYLIKPDDRTSLT